MNRLEQEILRHLQERGWDKLRPADIAKSIMIEGAELLELFQWENLPLNEIKNDKEKVAQISKELADVLIYALEMAVLLDLDSERIIRDKLAYTAKKYPAELMRQQTQEPGTESAYWEIKKKYRREGK